ncbi:peptide chain release factor N(5)-glutamine methyltransferase [Alteromonas sp. CI.11.F.A3]|uniref:peptide chain release factor N(5)-glutamine methyltransferase n=1 Tax=Alteromonas sp. CI.11.F.A3 TaxID=3079555 RepID=UPI002942C9E9|nr:peptide chain release factor N(5)-glutamine methyltransferase [Alteromonas sp. CI.11.F.A3]WOI36201.1 peptide chain release factor N(5)-glutamine methyltransferase [Alteromonas sp. CI.11.F.A3]
MRIDAALAWAVAELHEGESPAVDAKVLLSHVLDKPQVYLFTWPDKTLSVDELSRFKTLVTKRAQGMPVAYLTGSRDFWTLRLATSPHTLIPRPDTEVLVEQALACIASAEFANTRLNNKHAGPGLENNKLAICDLGTGTGAIALALASELPHANVTGVDLLHEAVQLSTHNAALNSITNAQFKQSSWFDNLTGERFHVIVSNPPYIETSSPFLQQGDVRFEPASALTSGADGLDDIKHIVALAPMHLFKGGLLAFEHGFDQAKAVSDLLKAQGFVNVHTEKDYGGNDRVTYGYLSTTR